MFLRTQLQEARWLIRSLEIRNETLLKVALTIVQRQKDFLELGEEHMRPMVLRDVAEAIEMHESTVSRVTTNKYMHTPRGVFEFRYFFSSHVAGEEGDQSSTAVRAKIRKLVSGEDPEKPLSDSQIAQMLSERGHHRRAPNGRQVPRGDENPLVERPQEEQVGRMTIRRSSDHAVDRYGPSHRRHGSPARTT